MNNKKSSILIHTCCAPCSANVFKELEKDYQVSCFFYNPNIWPEEEYKKRRDECKKYCKRIDISFIEPDEPFDYAQDKWSIYIEGLENEPEGGKRCKKCFELRLTQTAEYAKKNGFDVFATTLTISPHKNAVLINRIGEKVAGKFGIKFFKADWKKNDGYKKSCEISRSEDFYRQNYCGCKNSIRK